MEAYLSFLLRVIRSLYGVLRFRKSGLGLSVVWWALQTNNSDGWELERCLPVDSEQRSEREGELIGLIYLGGLPGPCPALSLTALPIMSCA